MMRHFSYWLWLNKVYFSRLLSPESFIWFFLNKISIRFFMGESEPGFSFLLFKNSKVGLTRELNMKAAYCASY